VIQPSLTITIARLSPQRLFRDQSCGAQLCPHLDAGSEDRHIRVNAVSPGVTETAGLNALFGDGENAESTKAWLVEQIPAGRVGQPEEIA
jgi:hypothetical protein